jgi:hypothetical protein
MTTDSNAALTRMFGAAEDGVFTGVVPRERNQRLKYWKKPDGGIALGPDVQTDAPRYQRFVQKGFKELPYSFGCEVVNSGVLSPVKVMRGMEHAWLKPFFEAGGLRYICKPTDAFGKPGEYLMSKEQLVALNLHRFGDVKAARPDVADATDLRCPYGCPDRLFSGVTLEAAQHSVDQHISAVHKDAVASRAVGDTIAQAMQSYGGGNAALSGETIAAIVAAAVSAVMKQAAGVPVVEHVEAEPELPGVSWDEAVEIFGFDPKQQANQWPEESWRPTAIHAYIKYRNTGPPEYPHDKGFWKAPPGGGSTRKEVLIAHITELHLKSAARKRALTGFVPTEENGVEEEPFEVPLNAFDTAPAA